LSTPVILATQEAKIRRIIVSDQPRICHTPSHWKKSCVCWHEPVIAAMAGSINREIIVQEGLGKK
jgi:hypothetical protein